MNQPDSELYIGLMSGTSLDGIDVAIVDFNVFPPRLLYSGTSPYDSNLHQRLRDLHRSPQTTLDALYRLDAELGEAYAHSVNQALKATNLAVEQIAALGCHGQTIWHSPDSTPAFTAQIGDPNRLCALTGITTVSDFRRKDIALGGQGAPLAPALHRFLFRSDEENRVVINIGGIANVTWLPTDSALPIMGFDTGPGNTLLDYWVGEHFGSPYDDGGSWASGGQVLEGMLNQMLTKEPYFVLSAPKTTGTEYFNPNWLNPYLQDDYTARDVQATLVELTAITLAESIRGLPDLPDKAYVCGGGAHNQFLLERLAQQLPESAVETTAALGLDPDFVEAVAFAWLARERIAERPGSLAEVTHASRSSILGGLYLPD